MLWISRFIVTTLKEVLGMVQTTTFVTFFGNLQVARYTLLGIINACIGLIALKFQIKHKTKIYLYITY